MKKLTQIIGLLSLAVLLVAIPAGCGNSTLAPAGVYQGDQTLYAAEKAITTTYKSFETFVKWENDFRSVLPVEVSRSADTIRLNGKKWIDTASALRDAYVRTPKVENKDKLQLSLNLIDTALSEATKYMAANRSNAPNKGIAQ